MPIKAGTINPDYPVWNQNEKRELMAQPFEIFSVNGPFKGKKFGLAWRVFATRTDTGERGLMLFAANAVRDDRMAGYIAALAQNPGETIGPCVLREIPLSADNSTWEIVDAPETATAKAGKGADA
jgi:hypothetical protein